MYVLFLPQDAVISGFAATQQKCTSLKMPP
jgi:hypothetical protein